MKFHYPVLIGDLPVATRLYPLFCRSRLEAQLRVIADENEMRVVCVFRFHYTLLVILSFTVATCMSLCHWPFKLKKKVLFMSFWHCKKGYIKQGVETLPNHQLCFFENTNECTANKNEPINHFRFHFSPTCCFHQSRLGSIVGWMEFGMGRKPLE